MYRYPYLIGLLVFCALTGIIQILVVLDCFFPLIEYAPDAVSSVMSTCSEVLAGLYGITLTGYIFFADRFKDTSEKDESLYDAVQALLPQGMLRFWINETLLLCFCTFDLILYFVISVLDPHKVKRISSQKKAKISEDQTSGNPEEFLEIWGEIEQNLYTLREELISKMRFLPSSGRNKPQLVQTLEILRNYGRINMPLWHKLEKLRQYHNLSLHDVNLAVSQEMCDPAKNVLEEL